MKSAKSNWVFEVELTTHELLQRGILAARTARVAVSRAAYPSFEAASLTAIQLAARTGYPTSVAYLE